MPRIYLSPPHMGPRERELLLAAFDSNWIAPLGPHVDGFERELGAIVGVPNVCALSSGTAALHLALVLLGVGAGDDVLVSSLTFAASANAITYVGARPVFVDSERASWNMCPDHLAATLEARKRAGKLPKAILVVDLYGQCADYARIVPLAESYGVPIIEDAAEALGATCNGRPAGSFGAFGVFSFNGNKIITTSGGGALVTHRPELAERARFLATQARDPAPHYQHSTIGYNYRLSNLLAAVGRGQLEVLADRVAARRANRAFYSEAFAGLPGVTLQPEAPWGTSTFWLTCLTIDEAAAGTSAEAVRLALVAADIEARPLWKPMHLQPVFAGCERVGGEVAERLFAEGLCLPSGSSLQPAEREEIAAIVRRCFPAA
ncbi:MAG: 4-keto-6-deoxy-N-acetyl-D-hexosaminyl-(lipid carrier) aminotransferase [Labilithrix sp.]|nr:4-keto-6-deoxy-N-acetyl-D-hexosaminyl-(lipid carrier) aminotransferase [Labilithrix sp.]